MPMIRGPLLATLFLGAGAPMAQDVYSTEPLKAEPDHDAVGWAIEAVALNNWLNAFSDSVPEAQVPALREGVYALISSLARQWFKDEDEVAYSGNNPVVPLLFNWAARFGVYGTDLVVETLDSEFEARPGPELPEGFRIEFEAPLRRLISEDGRWAARIPYYFMLWSVERRVEGADSTDFVSLSTLFGRHSEDDGSSQSTIVLLASTRELDGLVEEWLPRFQLDSTGARASDEVEGWRRYGGLPKSSGMLSEGHFVSTVRGRVMVFFAGMPGTYELNRVNYLDFIRSLEYENSPGQ